MKNPESIADFTKAIKSAARNDAARLKATADAYSTARKLRDETRDLVTRYLADSGLPLKKLDTLQKRLAAELQRAAAQEKAAALRLASAQKRALGQRIAQRSKAVSALATGPALSMGPFVVLDTPFLIWSAPLLELSDATTASFGSSVKFDFSKSGGQGTQSISFYYYWQSPFVDPVLINAQTFLSAVGHLQANASWSLWPAGAQVGAVALFDMWTGSPPIGTTPPQTDLGAVRALGTWIGGDSNGLPINGQVTLTDTMFAVPPRTAVIFEVALAIWYSNDDDGCDVDADFASGDFGFASPFVAFTISNPINPAWGVLVNPVTTERQ
jgi:hypothetical protein